MKVEINLNDQVKAKEEIKKIQVAIDELVSVCKSQEAQLKDNLTTIDASGATILSLGKAVDDLTAVVKAIFTVLGTKQDLFQNDADIKTLMTSMATFVVSSASVKHGVIKTAMGKGV